MSSQSSVGSHSVSIFIHPIGISGALTQKGRANPIQAAKIGKGRGKGKGRKREQKRRKKGSTGRRISNGDGRPRPLCDPL